MPNVPWWEWGWGKRKTEWSSIENHCKYGEGNGTPLQYSCLENPWTEEPGGLQSMASLRVGHNWVTSLSLFTFMHWRRKWQPTPEFLPGGSQGRGSLVGCRLWGCRVGHDWSDLAAATVNTDLRFLKCDSPDQQHQLHWKLGKNAGLRGPPL